MTTPTAAPCADCGTTGGYLPKTQSRPWRSRGLCRRCYDRHASHGTVATFDKAPRLAAFVTHKCAWCWEEFIDYPSVQRRYCSHRCHVEAQRDYTPDLPAMIAAKARTITAREIAERCADAAYELKLTESAALYRGLAWREAHPEQFRPEAMAALYPDPAGLALSAWAEDAERRAA